MYKQLTRYIVKLGPSICFYLVKTCNNFNGMLFFHSRGTYVILFVFQSF